VLQQKINQNRSSSHGCPASVQRPVVRGILGQLFEQGAGLSA